MSNTKTSSKESASRNLFADAKYVCVAVCIALVLLVAVTFSNALKGEFAFDDKDMIENNLLIRDLGNVGKIFSTSWWWGGARQKSDEYRPITVLSFALNYRVNLLDTFGYHLVNVALHAAVVLLIFIFIRILSGDLVLSAIAAAFFAAHPIHTEAINNVVGRAELLAAVFFFAALICYSLSFRNNLKKTNIWVYLLCLLFYFLGLLSKENAITLLPVIIIYDLAKHRLDIHKGEEKKISHLFLSRLPYYGCFVAVLIVYFALRINAIGRMFSSGMVISSLDNNLMRAKIAGDFFSYYLTAIKAIGYYVYLLVFPFNLSVDYSYNQIPLSNSLLEPRVALSVLMLIAACFSIIYYYRKAKVIPFFAVIFFFVTFAPVSNFFKTIATILGERLMYLPSAGFCLLLALVLKQLSAWIGRIGTQKPEKVASYALICLAAVIVVAYSARTLIRNNDWRTELRLFESAAQVSPNSARVHYNLGNNYKLLERYEQAKFHFWKAYGIAPFYGAPLGGIGEILRIEGNPREAEKVLKQVIEMEERYFPAHYNLGRTYADLGKFDLALQQYRKTIELRPTAPQPYYAMCEIYFKLERWEEAEEVLQKALEITTEPAFALKKLGVVYFQLNRQDEAIAALNKAIQINPRDPEPFLHLGQYHAFRKDNDAALKAFTRALELAPNDPDAHLVMARFLHQAAGDSEKALYHFRRVLQLNPAHPLRGKIIATMNEISRENKND
jgi:tetratricopeptide (TPR) repeat protein